jgi:hypothetical protein
MLIIPAGRFTYPDLSRYTAPPNARKIIIKITEFKLPDVPTSVADLESIYQNILRKEQARTRHHLQAFQHFGREWRFSKWAALKLVCDHSVQRSNRIAGPIV